MKISPVAGTGQTSGCSPSYLQYCSGCDRLGIVFQLFIRTGSRLYQSDVWCRCTWLCRQREYVSSYKQPDPVADPDIWLYAAGHFRYEHMLRYKKWNTTIINSVVYAALFIVCIAYLVTETYNPFLYFRF